MQEITTRAWSKKVYLHQVLFYGTIGGLMALPTCLACWCPLSIANFLSFFVIVYLRALCETHFLYGSPFKSVSFAKTAFFSLATAGLMTVFLILIKPTLGWFAIPVSIIFALQIVGKLKSRFWPNGAATDQLSQKIRTNTTITYVFFAIFVPITIVLYAHFHMNFTVSMASGYLLGGVVEELGILRILYKERLAVQKILFCLIWSTLCAGFAATSIWVMMQYMGLAGQPATIIGIILARLIQPLYFSSK
jgi:hypothetical protein